MLSSSIVNGRAAWPLRVGSREKPPEKEPSRPDWREYSAKVSARADLENKFAFGVNKVSGRSAEILAHRTCRASLLYSRAMEIFL